MVKRLEFLSNNEINRIINFEQVEVFENILVSSVIVETRKINPMLNNKFTYERFYKLKAKQFKS